VDASNGIDHGKTLTRRRAFDLFRPVSVKSDGRRIQSANWCVRFQHKGKRTCRSLGTADYRLAQQRARQLVQSVRLEGWTRANPLPTSHGGLAIEEFLERFQASAVSRGLRPRSIAKFQRDLRRIVREIGARRLADLTRPALQGWVQQCGLKPVTLRSTLKGAGVPFAKASLQALGLTGLENPFGSVVRPKVDQESFHAPARSWILELMQQGIGELSGQARLAFVLALGAGLRRGEIASLSWEDVQRDQVRVAASKAKGRRARVIPIGATVREVLWRERSQGPVIRRREREVHRTLCAWVKGRGVNDAKPVHYLRKCYGSLAVADHGIFLASKLLGHSNISITASTYAGQVDQLPAVKF
jgi:integrase